MKYEEKIKEIVVRIEDELSHYGHYLTMKGAKQGEQRLGVADLAIIVLTIIGWGVNEFVKALIQEKAKQLVTPKEKEAINSEQLIESIKNLIEGIDKKNLSLPIKYEISEEALSTLLSEYGLTSRASKKAAKKIKPILDEEIKLIIIKMNEENQKRI